jgi:hypothetical protein
MCAACPCVILRDLIIPIIFAEEQKLTWCSLRNFFPGSFYILYLNESDFLSPLFSKYLESVSLSLGEIDKEVNENLKTKLQRNLIIVVDVKVYCAC